MRVNTAELRKEADRRQNREKQLGEETTAGRNRIRIAPWAVIPAAVIVMAAMAFFLFGSEKLLQRSYTDTAAPTEAVEATPESTAEPKATPSEAPVDPAEAEKNRAYERALQLLECADAGMPPPCPRSERRRRT